MIVNVCPPAVIVPVRWDVTGLAATVKWTVPTPDPLDPLLIAIQSDESVADHAQPLPVFTVNEPVLKPDGAARFEDDSA